MKEILTLFLLITQPIVVLVCLAIDVAMMIISPFIALGIIIYGKIKGDDRLTKFL